MPGTGGTPFGWRVPGSSARTTADRPPGGRRIGSADIPLPHMALHGGEGEMQTASKHRTWTLAVVSLATAMLMLDIAVVNTAISDMGRDLHTGLDGLKWVVDAYTLALAAVVLTAGSLADRLGRKLVFAVGLAVFTIASAAAAAATDITMLNIIRAVQGLGAAAMFATSMALLAHE